ncbi:glycosyltransferase [Paenibacillus sp. MER TA 81-3]|nr:glycosyltransferase [Paenibacillus sp. MER TA 81-3]
MKILFVFFVPSGGMETLNRLRCQALKKRGIECHCLYFMHGAGMQNYNDTPTFFTNEDQKIQHIVAQGSYAAIIVVSAYEFVQKLREFGYEGLIIFEVQGYGEMGAAHKELTKAAPHLLPHANALLNPKTPYISDIFSTLFPHMRKYEFNNCLDTKSFTYRSLPKKPFPIIAWIGRLEERDNKNWREFLIIGHHLLQHNPKIQLWMFEDANLASPEERVQFEQMVHTLQLNQHLVLQSNVPNRQMPDYFSMIGDSGGMYCCTSKSEGGPFAVLEAMSCRCPVLTTDSSGVRSSVLPHVTGIYYTLGNIQEAVYFALQLMRNDSLRHTIVDNAQKHVKAHFSIEQYCSQFIAMLQDLGAKK